MRFAIWIVGLSALLARHAVAMDETTYQFERGAARYSDLVRLRDGTMRLGKVMEWGDRVLVFGAGGPAIEIPAADVEWIELRRGERHNERAASFDLTVGYVERLPRDASWHASVATDHGFPTLKVDQKSTAWKPVAGQEVTFRAHILNAGNAASPVASVTATVGGQPIGAPQSVPSLEPGADFTADFTWKWKEGDATLEIVVAPNSEQSEWLRWNNRLIERIDAQAVTVAVPKAAYEAFRSMPNAVESFCFEDYAQHQLRCLNALFAASRSAAAPEGVTERVRLDRVLILDDMNEQTVRETLRRDDGLADYDAFVSLWGGADATADDVSPIDALRIDWPALKRIGIELGLVDLAAMNPEMDQCRVLDRFERPAMVRRISTEAPTLMRTPGPFTLTPAEAAYLNHVRGRPRGLHGTFRYQLPSTIVIEVLGNDGTPMRDVQVDVFALSPQGSEPRVISGPAGDDPWVSMITDEAGRAPLPNLPCPGGTTPDGYALGDNPFTATAISGDGLLLLRLRHGNGESFHFLSQTDANAAYLRGETETFVNRIQTCFAPNEMPALPYMVGEFAERDGDHPDLTLFWPIPSTIDMRNIAEFRIYRRIGFGGADSSPWSLVEIAKQPAGGPVNNKQPMPYFQSDAERPGGSLDTWFAATAVDHDGRESALSEPAFLAHDRECRKFAIRDRVAYMTLSGETPPQMLYWDAVAGTQAYRPRTDRIPGYEPHYEGLAFGRMGMIVTDPVNHVLAVYDTARGRHELTATIPVRETWPGFPSPMNGEFNSPADVASDATGRIYVADRGNHRVQVLSPDGAFVSTLDPDFRFRAPHAVGFAFGHVCVTDNGGKRVRVYDVGGDAPKYVCQLPPLWDADRGLVGEAGEIFVTGRVATQDAPWSVHVFKRNGESATYDRSVDHGLMGKYYSPRGLYQHDGDTFRAYFANSFPFDVRIVEIGNPPRKP